MSLILANQVLIDVLKTNNVFDKASLDIEFTLKITSQVIVVQSTTYSRICPLYDTRAILGTFDKQVSRHLQVDW